MRLAVVSPFLDRQHGTELCIIEQIERFAQHDHWNIELYSQRVAQVSGVRLDSDVAQKSTDSIVWHKVRDIPGPHLLKYVWWFAANHWRRWRDRRSDKVRADLVYSPGINCLDADVIVVHIVFHEFYARVKSELELRRLPLRTWPLILHRKLYYKLIMMLERRIYPRAKNRLIAVSSLVAKQLEAHFGRTGVTVIPNSVDTKRFSRNARNALREDSRREFGYSAEDFVVLFIGNDWKKKGLDALLRAFALLGDLPLQLLIVGKDNQSVYQPLLDEMALKDRVRFEAPAADVVPFYACANLYISPALEDAFGLPILEAMACGLPVIASIFAGASDNVRDGETGLLLQHPRNPEEIAQQIRLLISDVVLREQIGLAAAQFAQANCSWDQNADRTREFLEAALHK